MEDKFIQLGKSDVLRLGIRTEDGKETGEYLEFDLEDIELPLKLQEMLQKNSQNKEHLQNQILIIDKRQDVKGKTLLSKNEEDKLKALEEFFKQEVEVYNMFLGENGVQKLLNGRKLTWTALSDIDTIIENQIMPYLNISMEKITNKIKEKYGKKPVEDKEVLR